MKTLLSSALRCGSLALVVSALWAQPFTTETTAELGTTLDANGDGRLDVLVVDRINGLRQLGLQQADGTLLWSEPESVGLDAITSLSAGRLTSGSAAEGFVVSASRSNRVHVVRNATATPLLLSSTGLGPALAVALDVTGAGNDAALDDFAIASEENGAPAPNLLGAHRWNGTALTGGVAAAGSGKLSRGNRVRLSTSAPWSLGALRDRDDAREFAVFRCDLAACTETQRIEGLPAGADYAWGNFGGSSLGSFLLFARGNPNLTTVRAVALGGGTFGFGAPVVFDLGAAIESVVVLPRTGGALLLVLFAEGGVAALYDFDGTNAPLLRQTLDAPPGARFTAVAPLGAGNFALLHGAVRSSGWTRWNHSGATHTLAGSGVLPGTAAPASGRGNVFVYAADPASSPGAALRLVLRASEWSVSQSLAGGVLSVDAVRFVDSVNGLGGTTTRNFGGGFAAGDHVAINQSSRSISVVAFAAPAGLPGEQVRFSPAPGSYALAAGGTLQVTLVGSAAGSIRFRTSADGAWQTYVAATPIPLAASTTLEAYLQTDRPSPIARGEFTLAAAPPLEVPAPVDADLDGMADAWEQQFALFAPEDDADGDGLSNRDEFFAGTDPRDAAAAPAATDLKAVALAVRADASVPGGAGLEITWPASVLGARLEHSTNLTTWIPAEGEITTQGGNRYYRHTPAPAEKRLYFRLHRSP